MWFNSNKNFAKNHLVGCQLKTPTIKIKVIKDGPNDIFRFFSKTLKTLEIFDWIFGI